MERIINQLRMHSLQGQAAAWREYSSLLASQFESAATSTEKTRLAMRYDEAMKQARTIQMLLEIVERQQHEARPAC